MAVDDHNESSTSAAEHRRENPIEHLSNHDIKAVALCLSEAALSLLALHRLAIDAHEADDEGWYLTAIKELARSTFKRLDACIGRLEGGVGLGNFASEFGDEDGIEPAA
jgi:hypothetical protein